jgi:hypothetical protein
MIVGLLVTHKHVNLAILYHHIIYLLIVPSLYFILCENTNYFDIELLFCCIAVTHQLSRMTMIESLIEFSAKFSEDPIDVVLMEVCTRLHTNTFIDIT